MIKPGEPYRPSNGSQGDGFMEHWCARCQRDAAFRDGMFSDGCSILAGAFATGGAPEWQYDTNGEPCCTAFVEEKTLEGSAA